MSAAIKWWQLTTIGGDVTVIRRVQMVVKVVSAMAAISACITRIEHFLLKEFGNDWYYEQMFDTISVWKGPLIS